MSLNTLAEISKSDFVEKTGADKKAVTIRVTKPKVENLIDVASLGFNGLIFGPWDSGKTYAIVALLELGFTVLSINTDLGKNGLQTVNLWCRKNNKENLLKKLFTIDLQGYEEVMDFLENPTSFDPLIYQRGINFVFWDGFSTFQTSDILEYIGENNTSKDPGELREAGLQLETLDWNAVANATMRVLRKFFKFHNKETGEIWNKIVTAQEAIRAKPKATKAPTEPTVYQDEKKPLISGKAGILAGAGFDLIVKTAVRAEGDKDDGKRTYAYITQASDLVFAKNRGFDLKPVEIVTGTPVGFWQSVLTQAGIKPGDVEASLKVVNNSQQA